MMEMVVNAEFYLSNDCLAAGFTPSFDQPLPIVSRYITYTNAYVVDCNAGKVPDVTNPEVIKKYYHGEVLQTTKGYTGLWEMAALANILNRPVKSVYTDSSLKDIQDDHMHTFLPRTETGRDREPLTLFWTEIEDCGGSRGDSFNHFNLIVRK